MAVTNSKSLYIFLLVLIAKCEFSYNYELNDICRLRNGLEGVCRLYEDCKSAKDLVTRGVVPQLCGSEFFCCEFTQESAANMNRNRKTKKDLDSRTNRFVSSILESTNCFSDRHKTTAKDTEEISYEVTRENDAKNGDEVINFMAKIGVREPNGDARFFCGGVLLSDTFVLTAAHCTNYKGRNPEIVQLGNYSHKTVDALEKIPISKIHVHPDYNATAMYHNLALIELVVPSSFLPACVWRWAKDNMLSNETVNAMGHDILGVGPLQSLTVDFMPENKCNDLYLQMRQLPYGITDTQYCILNSNVIDDRLCKGFVGGPLFARNSDDELFMIGLATYVKQCYSAVYPMIYTDITAYKDWLQSIIY